MSAFRTLGRACLVVAVVGVAVDYGFNGGRWVEKGKDWAESFAPNPNQPSGHGPMAVQSNPPDAGVPASTEVTSAASAPTDMPAAPATPAWKPPAFIPVVPGGTLTTPTQIYTNVRIIKVEADSVTISHAGGRAVVPMWQLGSELRQQLNYDPKAALAAPSPSQPIHAEAEPAQPMFIPPTGPTPVPAISETTDYKAALASAKASRKLVLLFFTGSDYCPPCKEFTSEVLPTAQFQAFIASNYVMVTLDFPRNNTQPESLKAQNNALHQKYNIQGVPTLIVIDAAENERGRMLGVPMDGTPNPVIAELEKYNQAKPAGGF